MSSPPLNDLVAIMARLRDPENGCPWDIEQSFETIAPYTIEEAHEVADAIARRDMNDLKDELGDLLLQVVFHSRIAEEAGHFAITDVVTAISEKMVRRHPHVFGSDPRETGHAQWEAIKAAERDAKPDKSALAGVALGLPALLRAEKLQKRAARTGFDWPDAEGPRLKIDEELAEIEQCSGADELEDEIGDLLFACVNWSRHLGIDPEAALRRANRKFETRFRAMEAEAGEMFNGLPLEEKDALWERVKAKAPRQ
ncbi:nucleoside triphosphate pyrophosphohydrolase [Sphingomonas colocasiae]|uniref:nucleoside triphosphate pyrophosphohydrolase n=1 Tax=Sphingomonas colocasiae TaxID=1848973 RepID=UPI0031BAEA62